MIEDPRRAETNPQHPPPTPGPRVKMQRTEKQPSNAMKSPAPTDVDSDYAGIMCTVPSHCSKT